MIGGGGTGLDSEAIDEGVEEDEEDEGEMGFNLIEEAAKAADIDPAASTAAADAVDQDLAASIDPDAVHPHHDQDAALAADNTDVSSSDATLDDPMGTDDESAGGVVPSTTSAAINAVDLGIASDATTSLLGAAADDNAMNIPDGDVMDGPIQFMPSSLASMMSPATAAASSSSTSPVKVRVVQGSPGMCRWSSLFSSLKAANAGGSGATVLKVLQSGGVGSVGGGGNMVRVIPANSLTGSPSKGLKMSSAAGTTIKLAGGAGNTFAIPASLLQSAGGVENLFGKG